MSAQEWMAAGVLGFSALPVLIGLPWGLFLAGRAIWRWIGGGYLL